MSKRIALLAVAVMAVAGLAVSAATASPKKQHDEAIEQSPRRHQRRGLHALRRSELSRSTTLQVAEHAGPPRQPLLGRDEVGRREQDAAGGSDRPGRSGVRLDGLRPARPLRDAVQHQGRLLDPLHARLGERRQGEDGRHRRTTTTSSTSRYAAAERYSGLWTPPTWQQDPAQPDDEAAAAEGEPVDGVERAEQPDLAHAAVQARRQDVARRERVPVREDLQRGLQRRALAVSRRRCRTSTSRAASPGRRGTTPRRRSARRSIR